MRFTQSKSGLFWTFFQPFLQIVIFVTIKSFFWGSGRDNFDYSVFLALNFIAFNMFKAIVKGSIGAFNANRALFNYKQVKPIDTIIARGLVEIFITGIIILIFLFIGYYFDYGMEGKNVAMVVAGYLWLIVFSFSLGLLAAVGNAFFDSIGKTVGMTLMILMFMSAVFYTVESLPVEMREPILYNPLTHFMEMIHGYYFDALDDGYVDYHYMTMWTILLLFSGLWLYKKAEERIISP